MATLRAAWDERELRRLRRAAQRYPRSLDKNARWKLIARDLKRGKRECYDAYQTLKTQQEIKKRGRAARAGIAEPATRQRAPPPTDARADNGEEEEEDVYSDDLEMEDTDELESKLAGLGLALDGSKPKPKPGPSAALQMEEVEDLSFEVEEDLLHAERKSSCGSSNNAPSWQQQQQQGGRSQHTHGATGERSTEVEEEDDELKVDSGQPLSREQLRGIKSLLFGTRKPQALDASWARQGFFFSSCPAVSYGLVQLKGGPCGVIAAVQAFVLRALLRQGVTKPTRREQQDALVDAIAAIITQAAGRQRHAVVCWAEGTGLEGIRCTRVRTGEVRKAIREHLGLFSERQGPGVGMLVCSAILTRGMDAVRGDIDTALGGNDVSLIGNHNYASQELVNLLLLGYACSNVFDGNQDVGDDLRLRGVQRRGHVGFLTLYEHFEYVRVGDRLKRPAVPVWVLCSESHYSVLFGSSEGGGDAAGAPFDLRYYDPLGVQREEYLLTVDPDPAEPVPHDTSDNRLVPPIEDCIRTRWPGATVDWNGAEPLL